MPTKFVAPGVKIIETDISEVVRPTGTSVGAVVGKTNKGPVNVRMPISNDKEFLSTFGKPETVSDLGHQASLAFLKESSQFFFTRPSFGDEFYSNVYLSTSTSAVAVSSSAILSASTTSDVLSVALYADGNTLTSQNGEAGIYDVEFAPTITEHDTSLIIASIGPGIYGNDVGVSIVTCASEEQISGIENGFNWQYKYDDPESTGVASSATDAKWKKVYRINVYTKPVGQSDTYWGNGTYTALSGTSPDETYLVSNYRIKDDSGASLFAPDVINGASSYIYVNVKQESSYPNKLSTITSLSNGVDGTASTAAQKQAAWTLYSDKRKVSVNILLVPDEPNTADIQTIIDVADIAASRQDSIAVGQIGTKSDLTTTQILAKQASYGFSNPSYVALYAGWDQVFDSFLDQKIFIPKAIYGATVMARTDRVTGNAWSAPAGLNRGSLPVLGQLKQYNETEIGALYDSNINTSNFIRGYGNILWGQKTAQRKASALDRINVRRLLLFVENSIEPTLLSFLWELNTDKTRSRLFSVVDGFMQTVLAGGGVTSYQVVCDATNNTSDDSDNNQLNVDIALAPSRAIEFIKLQIIITRTGISFSEIL